MKKLAIGVDIGGINTAFGLVDENGDLYAESVISTKKYPHVDDYPAYVEDLCQAMHALADSLSFEYELTGIGIGAPNANFHKGTVENPANLWKFREGDPNPDESRRLSRLVRRMLDVSQLQAIDPLRNGNHFDVCESMRRVLISMEKKINDRHLDVEADIPDEPILVLGDNDMITQVIYNLLENAAKFAREGSTLYLGVAMMDGKARITVRNVGETIPAEELPLLFERFHKSDKSRSEDKDGYGLGLYIVKTILQQHKEEINVTSENGVTTFTFSLRVE